MKIKPQFLNKKILFWTKKPGLGDKSLMFISSQMANKAGLDTYIATNDEKHYSDLLLIADNIKIYKEGIEKFDFIVNFDYDIQKPQNVIFQFLSQFLDDLTFPVPGLKIKEQFINNYYFPLKDTIILMCSSRKWMSGRRFEKYLELATELNKNGYKVLNLTDVELIDIPIEMSVMMVNSCKLLIHCNSAPDHIFSGLNTKKLHLFCHNFWPIEGFSGYNNTVVTKETNIEKLVEIIENIVK